ncbi:hypothetical protein GOEFS_115_01060 [Gordonia effusa NBRC 100432]|uniref:DUF1156 domain-containing protein n=1 Tax=Gordonia effusa NBRC 100432 TaxID=1077974 RepID=H0R5W5_9ACTN|nr:hypothetical protein GOEFS_115_01060 [Gordonia effusa NBRC 100432]
MLFAQLVDDPSSRPDLYPTDGDQDLERKRLFELIERLVVWENSNDDQLLHEAHQKILESTNGHPPAILDPFAGGGTIPLEAQRLGLDTQASDLNPVAVLINKALIEIPPKFAGRPPIFPDAAAEKIQSWPRATGLAEDVRRYGRWMRDEAETLIGHLYPQVPLQGGSKATAIAWIWTRTVTCPNPECRIAMPLVRSWWLSKKKGNWAYVTPKIDGKTVTFEIGRDAASAPTAESDGTVGRSGATCLRCGTAVELKYIRAQGKAGRLGTQLMATVAEGHRQRIYLAPTAEHTKAADVPPPVNSPEGDLPDNPRDFKTPNYGMATWASLFTPRQLMALITLTDLVREVRDRVHRDAVAAGIEVGERLDAGGDGAAAYADAIATYLALAVSRTADRSSAIASWDSSASKIRNTFGRQAIPMNWDFCESNIFSNSTGSFVGQVDWPAECLDRSRAYPSALADQVSASARDTASLLISTDPPYYDNIGYSDLSDFFYIWLRRALHDVHPSIMSTMLVPKAEELVANPYRHQGRDGAHRFFEDGFHEVFLRARETALPDFPITVYYAFKQQDSSVGGQASTGWETLLEGMIRAGWQITATWPMRSELGNRMLSHGTNALASSIVLALRPRPETTSRIDRRGFLSVLKSELPQKLRELQQGSIAPVDLPQAAIGPGMAVFSRYSAVLEDDGSTMTVRTALQRINSILDEVTTELENDFDTETRFALAWFRQNGFSTGTFSDAESIANARGVSLDHLARAGILVKGGGKVSLIAPEDMPGDYDPAVDRAISEWEVVMQLTRVLTRHGIPSASALLGQAPSTVDRELCKELAHLMFKLAEEQKMTQLAITFNSLGAAWNDIARGAGGHQTALL